ncbi:radical SAM protein [bacterium]|nr:radical SAM protein [bacterium]
MSGTNETYKPGWLALAASGELTNRAERALELAAECRLCPRACRAKRSGGQRGACGADSVISAPVASAVPHFGEEPPLVGTGGSGTVFFAGCGLHCLFCQNFQISHLPPGGAADSGVQELDAQGLAGRFLALQRAGCHNLNLVTASSHLPVVLAALELAAASDCRLPVVWNSGGYETAETLALLDGVVDIYLPDMKFGSDEAAQRLSEGRGYVELNRAAVSEMFRQVGLLELDARGVAVRGLIVRHLILPGGLAGTRQVLEFLSRDISRYVQLSLMSQYFPSYRATVTPGLERPITVREYEQALALVEEFRLENVWAQALESRDNYCPDFERDQPFQGL